MTKPYLLILFSLTLPVLAHADGGILKKRNCGYFLTFNGKQKHASMIREIHALLEKRGFHKVNVGYHEQHLSWDDPSGNGQARAYLNQVASVFNLWVSTDRVSTTMRTDDILPRLRAHTPSLTLQMEDIFAGYSGRRLDVKYGGSDASRTRDYARVYKNSIFESNEDWQKRFFSELEKNLPTCRGGR